MLRMGLWQVHGRCPRHGVAFGRDHRGDGLNCELRIANCGLKETPPLAHRNSQLVRPLIVVALTTLVAPGCVRRTVTVRTDPQGAAVVLNDQHIGTSPVSVDFTWYGEIGRAHV